MHDNAAFAGEVLPERLGFLGVEFAGSDTIFIAQGMGEQPWRARIGVVAIRGAAGGRLPGAGRR